MSHPYEMNLLTQQNNNLEGEEYRFKAARPGIYTSHIYVSPYGSNFKNNSKDYLLKKYLSISINLNILKDIVIKGTHTYVSFEESEAGRLEATKCMKYLNEKLSQDILPRKLKCRYSIKFSKSRILPRPAMCQIESSNENDNVILNIPGLKLYHNAITLEEEEQLINDIDNQAWNCKLKRRVQHYGYTFNYLTRNVDYDKNKPPQLPTFLLELYEKLFFITNDNCDDDDGENNQMLRNEKYLLSSSSSLPLPDQCTINEYLPGQGISSHIDTHSAFHDRIMSLSLASPTVMNFYCAEKSKEKIHLLLPRRSLLILSNDARYMYAHGISPRKTDVYPDDTVVNRGRRVSITLRNVNFNVKDGKSYCDCKYDGKYCDSKGANVVNGEMRLKN